MDSTYEKNGSLGRSLYLVCLSVHSDKNKIIIYIYIDLTQEFTEHRELRERATSLSLQFDLPGAIYIYTGIKFTELRERATSLPLQFDRSTGSYLTFASSLPSSGAAS